MSDKSHTKYQQNVIKRFYDNRDAISLQRAQELVTELYLAAGKKREKVWDSLANHMEKAGFPKSRIDHLREQDDAALVAKAITEKV